MKKTQQEKLDHWMEREWAVMRCKHPHFNASFLYAMHKLLDKYEAKLKKITMKNA